jgi:hypothetical protein
MRLDHVDEPHRAVEHLDAASAQAPVERLVLAIAEPAHGFALRRVVRIAVWQFDAAGFKENADPFVARPAVDEAVVVAIGEGVVGLAAIGQESVEHILPGSAVERGGVGDDAVEIEHARGVVGEVEESRAIRHASVIAALNSLSSSGEPKASAVPPHPLVPAQAGTQWAIGDVSGSAFAGTSGKGNLEQRGQPLQSHHEPVPAAVVLGAAAAAGQAECDEGGTGQHAVEHRQP